jgi:hypothetical protein
MPVVRRERTALEIWHSLKLLPTLASEPLT